MTTMKRVRGEEIAGLMGQLIAQVGFVCHHDGDLSYESDRIYDEVAKAEEATGAMTTGRPLTVEDFRKILAANLRILLRELEAS